MDWAVVEDLPVRCGALREAEINWHRVQFLRSEDEKIWMSGTSDGYDLRNVLVHHFRYAFRDDSSLILRVSDISQRIIHSGMMEYWNNGFLKSGGIGEWGSLGPGCLIRRVCRLLLGLEFLNFDFFQLFHTWNHKIMQTHSPYSPYSPQSPIP
ncbi:MAG: hypothetical protein PVH61_16110 [Candidatus Aminicenantes bacterium]